MKHITEFGEGIPTDSPVTKIRELPDRQWGDEVSGITALVIVPATKRSGLHDSGYRCLDFAAEHFGRLYCLLSGCSDVIHLGGISGYNNKDWVNLPEHERVRRGDWSIDCLPSNGLLRLFSHSGELVVGPSLSSFEVFSTDGMPKKIESHKGNDNG